MWSRLAPGWHSEVFDYQFTPEAIRARVANLRTMAEETIPAWLSTNGGLLPPQPYEEEMSAAPYQLIKEKLGGGSGEEDIPGLTREKGQARFSRRLRKMCLSPFLAPAVDLVAGGPILAPCPEPLASSCRTCRIM